MKRSIAMRWIKALESGDYKQGKYQLRNERDEFCCLGVLCNLHAQEHPEIAKQQLEKDEYLHSADFLPGEVLLWANMKNSNGSIPRINNDLVNLNDQERLTFPQIAQVIRKHWKDL